MPECVGDEVLTSLGLDTLADGDPEAELQRLREDVNTQFDLARLSIVRSPLVVATTDVTEFEWPHRINQCLIKGRGSRELVYGPFCSPSLSSFVDSCLLIADDLELDHASRYLYVTVDTAPVASGVTQRVPGWHFDDLQGPDIAPKQAGGFLFVTVSCLPTEFAIQSFDSTGIDDTVHNVFDWCGRQVQPQFVHPTRPGAVSLLSAYDVHRAVPAERETTRVFIRLLSTHCPLTSTKTTLNPAMDYDHLVHTTNGRIPTHLV
jgi:hypothetical protein